MNWVQGFDEAITKIMTSKPTLEMVDYTSLVVGGIHTWDAPDFCDAYFESGYYLDGTELPDDVLETLTEDGDLLYEHILKAIY